LVGGEGDLGAFGEAPAAHQTFPGAAVVVELAQEEDFHCAAGGFVAVEAGGDHPAVVDDEQIAGVQIIAHVAELAMLHATIRPVQDQETAGVPGLHGLLGDEGLGQVVVEQVSLQVKILYVKM